jgi:DNA modification methylase
MSDELKAGKVVRIGDSVTLIFGDCLAHLPIEADAVITDPPYGIGLRTDYGKRFPNNKSRQCYDAIYGDDVKFDPTPWLKYKIVAMWGANNYATNLPPGAWLIWQKTHQPNPYYSDAEIAWMNVGRMVRIYRIDQLPPSESPRNAKRATLHPTQKPVALMAWTMERAKVPIGATVLDPYAGSGSTVIACLRTGRNCIAMEKDPTYFAVMVERVKRELSQPFLPSCGTADTDKKGCQDDWLLPTNQKNETDEHGEPE